MSMQNELDRHLVEFAQLLRDVGIRVSLSEILDAMQGLVLIGMEDKDRVETVLQATMVKGEAQIPWFKEAFRAYFAPPEQQKTWQAEATEKKVQWEKDLGRGRKELQFQGRELDLSEDQRMVYAQLPEEEQQRLQDFLNKSSQGTKSGVPIDQSYQPMMERMVRGSLEYWRRKLEEDAPLLPPGSSDGVFSEVERALREKEIQHLAQDIKRISPEDWPEVIKLIRRLSQRLASQVSRRYRAARRRGGIDMRRTVRKNLRYGGVLVERHYRSRHTGRPKFVILCDISGSMLKYTEFVLQFVYGLASVVSGIETFAFGEELIRLTDKIHHGKSFQQMIEQAMPVTGKEWGGGTNLAISLDSLLADYSSVMTKRTVLIILSDTQTLEAEKAAGQLQLIRRKVRDILWLNTLPTRRWTETQTVELFRPHCQMHECNTLGHLTNILNERL